MLRLAAETPVAAVETDFVACNGVDGSSGTFLLPGMDASEVARAAQGRKFEDADDLEELRRRHRDTTTLTYALPDRVSPRDLEQVGWAVVFAQGCDQAVKDALSDLLALRRRQAGALYKELVYKPGETKNDFLVRQKLGPGQFMAERLPYYVLLVGGPEAIPFRFQYQLDVRYAVGRVAFATPIEYRNFARRVVDNESRGAATEPRASFFAVRNRGDQATQLSADSLVKPLAATMQQSDCAWKADLAVAAEATKERLCRLINGGETGRILFTASHGMGFPLGHALQTRHQGALLCQDWPGPLSHRGAIPPEWYFSADDVHDDAAADDPVIFMFACFAAGTPRMDEFSRQAFAKPQPIAAHDFLAALPQRLMGKTGRGALAVIAHVERAWGYSIAWPGAGPQLGVFENTLDRIVHGEPLGHALEYFNDRYAELATMLTTMIDDAEFSTNPDPVEIAGTWTAHNDARSYVLLGDPAVSIR